MGRKKKPKSISWPGECLVKGLRKKVMFRAVERRYTNRTKWRVKANPPGQKPIDVEVQTQGEAYQIFERWMEQNNPDDTGHRQVYTRLTRQQHQDAQDAVALLPAGATLVDCVKEFQKLNNAENVSVKEAIERYVKAKTAGPDNPDGDWVSARSIKHNQSHLNRLLEKLGGKQVKQIRSEEITPIYNDGSHDQTRLNRFRALNTFFVFCLEQNFHFENPMVKLKAPIVRKESLPSRFTVEQAEQLLYNCINNKKFLPLLPFLSLMMFAGLRAGEIHNDQMGKKSQSKRRLEWKDFTFNPGRGQPFCSLPFTGRRRSARSPALPENLAHLLTLSKKAGLDLLCKNMTNLWAQLRKDCGLVSKPHTLRHTAISFWYHTNPFVGGITTQDEMEYQFGNSQDVQLSHYRNMAKLSQEAAEKFWALGLDVEKL